MLKSCDDAAVGTVLGDQEHALGDGLAGRARLHRLLPRSVIAPPSGWRWPNSVSASAVLPTPTSPVTATISPSPSSSEKGAAPGAMRRSVGRENRPVGILHRDLAEIDLLAEHGVHRALVVERLGVEDAGNAAVAQADDAVGQAPDVGHAVRDIEDRHAFLRAGGR